MCSRYGLENEVLPTAHGHPLPHETTARESGGVQHLGASASRSDEENDGTIAAVWVLLFAWMYSVGRGNPSLRKVWHKILLKNMSEAVSLHLVSAARLRLIEIEFSIGSVTGSSIRKRVNSKSQRRGDRYVISHKIARRRVCLR